MLAQLLGSEARVKVLSLFLTHPDRDFYGREIGRLTGLLPRAVHRELTRLTGIGILQSAATGFTFASTGGIRSSPNCERSSSRPSPSATRSVVPSQMPKGSILPSSTVPSLRTPPPRKATSTSLLWGKRL